MNGKGGWREWYSWERVSETATANLIAQRTNLSPYLHLYVVRERLKAINEEINKRAGKTIDYSPADSLGAVLSPDPPPRGG